MTDNRLPDYLDHIQQAAIDACCYLISASGISVKINSRI